MADIEHDIDIAITFVNQDLGLANDLRDSLSSTFENVFVYASKQEELAGTDGLETLRQAFRYRSRLVVILFRERWGQTDWTRVEEQAITDRFLKEGAKFLFVVMMDDSTPPPWLPESHIRFSLKDFGIKEAVGAIKMRALERGSVVHRPSVAARAAQAQRQVEFGNRKVELFRTAVGVQQVEKEVRSLFKLLSAHAEEAKNAAPGLNMEYGCEEEACVIRTRGMAVTCWYLNRITNVLDEARLTIREVRGAVVLPGENAYAPERPRELAVTVFKPELTRAEGWCWKNESGEILTSEQIVDLCLNRFFARANQLAQGALPWVDDDE
jgi:hypothetical protein